jgi:elongation factor Ts
MAEVTAGMVRELREKTDAPMMECKKALTEAAGDMAKAEEILRIKLGNKASKAASRVAAEGVVAAYIAPGEKTGRHHRRSTAKLISLRRTTSFWLSRRRFARLVANEKPADVQALSQLALDGETVEARRATLVGKSVRTSRCAVSNALMRKAASRATSTAAPKSASWWMWSAATKHSPGILRCISPRASRLALSRDEVPAEDVQKERTIACSQSRGVG